MYSQPWSPMPSTTATAPELRTAKRSPARPRKNALPGGGAVEHRVADDHVLLGAEGRRAAAAARRACRPTCPCRCSRWRRPRARASRPARARRRSSGRPSPADATSIEPVGQPLARRGGGRSRPTAARPPRGSCSRSGARAAPARRRSMRRPRALQQVEVDRVVEHRLRPAHAVARRVRRHVGRRLEQRAQVDAAAPSSGRPPRPARAGRCGRSARPPSARRAAAMIAARLLGDHEQVVDDVLGLALEAAPQLRILGGDPDRAGVEVADAHHHAAERDQRGGREAELVGAEDRRR